MKTVLANGCFDLLHVAHLRHLEEARTFGHRLVVGVTLDDYVGKGAGRPVIPQAERLEMVRGLRCVDDAFLCKDSLDALRRARPDIFVKGNDYLKKGLLMAEIKLCEAKGIEIRLTSPNPQTTTEIIGRLECV